VEENPFTLRVVENDLPLTQLANIKMKIVIVGPGAIGILFGARLIASGQEVTFLDYNYSFI